MRRDDTNDTQYDEDAGKLGDSDDIVCRRCGREGLYWQRVTTYDGKQEKSVLFDGNTRRKHICHDSGAESVFEVIHVPD